MRRDRDREKDTGEIGNERQKIKKRTRERARNTIPEKAYKIL